MSINYYGVPMLPSSKGLNTLMNFVEQGSAGGERIMLDPELCSVIYAAAATEEAKYKELADAAKKEFDIKGPDPVQAAKLADFIFGAIVAGFEYALEFGLEVIEFGINAAGKVLNTALSATGNALGQLFKGPGGLLLIGGAAFALIYFLK